MEDKIKALRERRAEKIEPRKDTDRKSLKEICPNLSEGQRKRLGVALSKHGLKRYGAKISEDYMIVNTYKLEDAKFIKRFAEGMYNRVNHRRI